MLRALVIIPLLSTLCISFLSHASSTDQHPPYYLWWEAEDTIDDDFPQKGEFDPKNAQETALLSNGRWINVAGKHPKHFAHYSITVDKPATYHLYTRKFWYHGGFRYRFNQDEWINIKQDNHPLLLDAAELREHVVANWVYLGKHSLAQGAHRFEIELLNTEGAAAFDSFVLSDSPFIPLGLRKPGEKLNLQENNRWSFEPDIDPFSTDSLWDLRDLNEATAGMHGYVGRDQSNNHFVLGNGKPVRFWAMNTNVQESPNMGSIDYHGRHLAKRGFNMVRFHGFIESKTADLFTADAQQIEYSWRLVAAMKKHGIYTTLSPYWGTHAKSHPKWQGLRGNENGKLDGLLFFNPTLQKAYKSWLKQWLTTPNPYTNIPLAKDPAVAIFQIQNEDSLLFWTTNNIKGEHLKHLEKRYTHWVLKRYKSLDKVEAMWGELKEARDSTEPHLTLLPLHNLTKTSKGKRKQRLDDQYAFFIDVMTSWNKEVERFLREEIGYKGLINAGNWRTAKDQTMLDGERLSYADNQVMATNRYYSGGKHINPNKQYRSGYRVEKGDLFEGQSILFHPHKLPVNIKQVDGYPMIVSESTWSNPNPHQAEAPFLIAAYSSLNDIDGYYWFSADEAIGFANQLHKFPAASPILMAGYPAAALMYRNYYIKTAAPSINEYRTIDNIIAREPPVVSEGSGFDPNRDAVFALLKKSTTSIEKNRVFLQGPVISHYSETQATKTSKKSTSEDQKSVIRSTTDELLWDYRRGINSLDSPKAQGAVGFLSEQSPLVLSQLSISGQTPYASVMLVSLDNLPIDQSKRLLLQITTQSQLRGYRTSPKMFKNIYNSRDEKEYDGKIIEHLGTMPFMIKNHQLKLKINSTKIDKITVTDSNGYALSTVDFVRAHDGIEFTPPADSIYLVLSGQ